jgi:hypothetical protein
VRVDGAGERGWRRRHGLAEGSSEKVLSEGEWGVGEDGLAMDADVGAAGPGSTVSTPAGAGGAASPATPEGATAAGRGAAFFDDCTCFRYTTGWRQTP